MINRAIIILPLLILLTVFSSFGQSNVHEAEFKGGEKELGDFLGKKLAEQNKKDTTQLCITSVTFAQFTINKKGNIDSIIFYQQPQTPPIIKQKLTSIINATNGNWIPKTINGEPVESRPFILPLLYDLEAGCDIKGKEIFNTTYSALRGLFGYDFDSKGHFIKPTTFQLDCVLLKPISLFSAK